MENNQKELQPVRCLNICKKYKNKEVLHNINLTIDPGKIYGLIGRNGVGKTTLLSIMSAQALATSGQVTFGNDDIWENQEALNHICFSRELNPAATNGMASLKIRDYLNAAAIYYPAWDQKMAEKLVDYFQLDPKKRINKLSKGMLSMVTIVIALASKADYTILDEPVAGLDVFMRDKFYRLLLEEYDKTGRTFIISTHIIDEASPVFEEVIILKDGAILLKENTQDLLAKAVHISGKAEDVDRAVSGMTVYHPHQRGRSKNVTVFLEDDRAIISDSALSIQPATLQSLFIALCGDDSTTELRILAE